MSWNISVSEWFSRSLEFCQVAAVCVYPEFVSCAKSKIASCLPGSKMRVATVVNFPSGDGDLKEIEQDTKAALDFGADEIDLVICYKEYLESSKTGQGQSPKSCKLVQSIKDLIQQHARGGSPCCLKVILETGELKTLDLIRKASQDALEHGADFLKTSTGKTAAGASLEAARVMLEVIKEHSLKGVKDTDGPRCGLKISGGVRTFEDALGYMQLVKEVLAEDASEFLSPKTFRFGVSGLLSNLLREDAKGPASGSAYWTFDI